MIGSIDTIGDEATLTQMPYQWPKVRKLLEAARRHVGLLITSAVGSFVCVENDPLLPQQASHLECPHFILKENLLE
jgi:hypothetical protein